MRFPNFSKNWNKSELKTFANRINRRNVNNESSLPLTISAQFGLINQNDFFNKQIASRDLSNYILIKNGEFAYNKSYSADYPWGAIKRLDLYEKGVLSSLYICFSLSDNVVSDYFVHYFESSKWHKQISDIAGEGARNHGLLNMSVSDFFETGHKYPTKEEQTKISNFLNLINERILTQSKIIEDLKIQRKYICNNIFHNKSDSAISLKQILKERVEKSIINNQYEPLSSTVKGLFTQKEYFDGERSVLSNVGYKVVHLNDIILSPQNLWMGNITLNQRFERGIVSPSYKTYIVNSNYDCYYIFNMLKTNRAIYKYIMCSEQGASIVRRNLNIDDFLDLKFNIPSLDTQKIMSRIINTMDEKILLEQSVLEKLKEQKKYLLSNMFI